MVRYPDTTERRRRARTALLLIGAAVLLISSCKPEGPTEPVDDPGPGDPDGFSVTLEWNAPTEDAEGNPLEDLLGYRVHYRDATPANGPGASTSDVGAADTRTTISGVPAGVWYFGVTALDVAGNESLLSNELRVEVGP